MKIHLERVTADNVDDVLKVSERSTSPGFPLPQDGDDVTSFLGFYASKRRQNKGNGFVAYGGRTHKRLVGGGEVILGDLSLTLGYWVVQAYRRQGVGTAIITLLEAYAATHFPQSTYIEAHIDSDNTASLALAARMGYQPTGTEIVENRFIYRKMLHES